MTRLPTWAALLLLVTACGHTTYHTYRHPPLEGWSKNDTLVYDVPRAAGSGPYALQVELRTDRRFPFTSLTLIVERTLVSHSHTALHRDTLLIPVAEREHRGVSRLQHGIAAGSLYLRAGDSLHIAVHHDMKRDILPGITDVGIQISEAAE